MTMSMMANKDVNVAFALPSRVPMTKVTDKDTMNISPSPIPPRPHTPVPTKTKGRPRKKKERNKKASNSLSSPNRLPTL